MLLNRDHESGQELVILIPKIPEIWFLNISTTKTDGRFFFASNERSWIVERVLPSPILL